VYVGGLTRKVSMYADKQRCPQCTALFPEGDPVCPLCGCDPARWVPTAPVPLAKGPEFASLERDFYELPQKTCPNCGFQLALVAKRCHVCAFDFERHYKEAESRHRWSVIVPRVRVVMSIAILSGAAIWTWPTHATWFALSVLFTAVSTAVGALLVSWASDTLAASGFETARTHEWRYVTKNGTPGARSGPATERDVYEHLHGVGSWEASQKNGRLLLDICVTGLAIGLPLIYIHTHRREAVGAWGEGIISAGVVLVGILTAVVSRSRSA
jgi:hypothetical protein